MTTSSKRDDDRHRRLMFLIANASMLASNVLFGLGNVVGKIGLDETNPIVFALLRELMAGPLLLFAAFLLERHTMYAKWRRKDGRLFVASGCCVFGSNFCYILGLKFAGSTSAGIWQPSQPLFITLLAIYVGFERATFLKFGGIAIAAGGCLYVSLADAKGDEGHHLLVGNAL